MSATPHGSDGRYNIRVLDRAFRMLELLAEGTELTLTEISQAIGLNTSTTFRMVASLEFHRYLSRNEESGKYTLGLACLELAKSFQAANALSRLAAPDLEALRDDVRETVHLAVLDGSDVVYLQKLPGLHAIGFMESSVGGRLPAYCTGLGKALLAYADPDYVRGLVERGHGALERFTPNTITDVDELMDQLMTIRERGFAFDSGEHEPDVRCVAVPVFGRNGGIQAAISVTGPANRMEPLEENWAVIHAALATAAKVSMKLGFVSSNPQRTASGAPEEVRP
ncbi:MAG: IclR family transcriptional regulator [Truepera sp.]|jgi:DNA-binding IclR family transcriptional regulator|nr:IclR family transcriptional regulator [Truepera sp.]